MRRGALFTAIALLAGLCGLAHSADLEIDRVELIGVKIFTQSEVEAALEITAGDRFDRSKVVRTAENLQAIYQLRGYQDTNVRSEVLRQRTEEGSSEVVLKFLIEEGKPTRVAAIRLIPRSMRDNSFKPVWERLEPNLRDKLGVEIGDIFDQEKISIGKRAIQDALASEDFVGARVDDVRVANSEAPKDYTPEDPEDEPVSGWVDLELPITLGDRVIFGFRGNTVLTRTNLMTLVEEQRALGFSQDYLQAIKVRIEDAYRAAGYARATVTLFTFERPERQERRVTYEINEGPRIRIDSIEFEGNQIFQSDDLREQLLERSSPAIQQGIYVDKDVEKAAELLIEWMKMKGYLSAKLVTINRIYMKKGRTMRLTFYLYEGEQTQIQTVRVDGVRAFAREQALSILGVQEKAPLNLFAFTEGLEQLKAAYRAKGYLDVRVVNEGTDSVVRYSQENRVADIHVEVAEGPQYRAGKILIEGLTSTKEKVARRELQFQEGDILEEPLITESEARLRKLGIFASVSVKLTNDSEHSDRKIIRVVLQEGTPGLNEGGVGFRNDLGVRVFAQTAYSNLWRRNHTIALNAQANRRVNDDYCDNTTENAPGKARCFLEYQVQLSYVWPWFALGETTFRPRLSRDVTQYITFDASTAAMALTWDRRLFKKIPLTGIFTYSLERTKQFDAASILDEKTLRIGALIPALKLDYRDNSLAPTRGFYSSVSYELASPAFFSQRTNPIGYTRVETRSDYFQPLGRNTTWYFSVRSGWARNNEPSSSIPLIKQFALGGVGSLRGFKEQELNQQRYSINGSLSYINYRTQIDVPFAGPMRFGPFLDAANLTIDHFSFGGLRYGTGVGFHYQSPVGPVNFDWGFKIKPRPGEDPYRFYFSVGVI